MNILFIGSTSGTACQLHYFTNLIRLGHAVIPFDPKYFDAATLFQKMDIRLRRGPASKRVATVASLLVSLAKQNHFDVVFVMAENFFGGDTINEMRRVSKVSPKFLYHSHDNNFSAGICKPFDFEDTLRAYDFVFTTKSQNVERYKNLGQSNSFFIPSAFEPTVHRPISSGESRFEDAAFEVSFVGTYDKSRDDILSSVGWERLNVWGDHWKRFSGYRAHHDRIVPRAIYAFEFADVISHTKCSLGLLRAEAEDRHTQRTFEIPACGSLQVAPRNEEILSFFDEKKEIVCYETLEELQDCLSYYLKKDTERKRIAEKGYARVLKDEHTYLNRVREMLQIAFSSERAGRSKRLSHAR